MKKNTKRNLALVPGILCIVLAIIVFVLEDGLRRWYSGIFFVILVAVMLTYSKRSQNKVDE